MLYLNHFTLSPYNNNLKFLNLVSLLFQHGGNKENAQSLASPLKLVKSPKKPKPLKQKGNCFLYVKILIEAILVRELDISYWLPRRG